jgi:hypothetical protein
MQERQRSVHRDKGRAEGGSHTCRIGCLACDGWLLLHRCKASLILKGTIECYYVFDKTSYRTGLNTLKNTAPYTGISLNFCAIQLDGGPVKTSTICFDNSGIDPNHPYVIAKVCTRHYWIDCLSQ